MDIFIFPFEINPGTDDDLPPTHNNQAPRGSRVAGNRRSAVGSVPFPMMPSDMESQIHLIEQEAYGSILRAFKAQSDALTWVHCLSLFHVFISLVLCI